MESDSGCAAGAHFQPQAERNDPVYVRRAGSAAVGVLLLVQPSPFFFIFFSEHRALLLGGSTCFVVLIAEEDRDDETVHKEGATASEVNHSNTLLRLHRSIYSASSRKRELSASTTVGKTTTGVCIVVFFLLYS